MISDELYKQLQSLEEELWREETRFNPKRMKEIIADDFTEIGQSGRCYTRNQILQTKARPINATLPLPNFTSRTLSENVVLVNYDSVETEDNQTYSAHRTSIWSYSNNQWQLRFHQGTPFNNKI